MTPIERKLQTDPIAHLIEAANDAIHILESTSTRQTAGDAFRLRLAAGQLRDCLTDLEYEHPHCDLEEVPA